MAQLCIFNEDALTTHVKMLQLSDYVQRNASRNVLWQDWSRLQSLSNQMARNINNLQAQSEMIRYLIHFLNLN